MSCLGAVYLLQHAGRCWVLSLWGTAAVWELFIVRGVTAGGAPGAAEQNQGPAAPDEHRAEGTLCSARTGRPREGERTWKSTPCPWRSSRLTFHEGYNFAC